MSHSCAFSGIPISTAYDSLGPDGLKHSLQETEARGIYTNADLLGTLTKVIGECPSVRLVVYDGKPEQKQLDEIAKTRENIKVIHIDEVTKLGKANLKEARPAKPEDVYCCMYTSGSSEQLNSFLPCPNDLLICSQLEPPRVCCSRTGTSFQPVRISL